MQNKVFLLASRDLLGGEQCFCQERKCFSSGCTNRINQEKNIILYKWSISSWSLRLTLKQISAGLHQGVCDACNRIKELQYHSGLVGSLFISKLIFFLTLIAYNTPSSWFLKIDFICSHNWWKWQSYIKFKASLHVSRFDVSYSNIFLELQSAKHSRRKHPDLH